MPRKGYTLKKAKDFHANVANDDWAGEDFECGAEWLYQEIKLLLSNAPKQIDRELLKQDIARIMED